MVGNILNISTRIYTETVSIGDIKIGGNNPIKIQTMTNTKTHDITSTLNQILELHSEGAEIIRIAINSKKDIESAIKIKNELNKLKINIPIIADVHFSPILAIESAKYFEKVRINPGNFLESSLSHKKNLITKKTLKEKFLNELISVCKEKKTAIRIGVNHGSLSWRIVEKFGHNYIALIESAIEFTNYFENKNFSNIVLSFKSSNVLQTILSNIEYVKVFQKKEKIYPLHIGVTEAGTGIDAKIKSGLGVGILLLKGIGDTIRISLTDNPIYEIKECKKILSAYNYLKQTHINNNPQLNINSSFFQKLIIQEKDINISFYKTKITDFTFNFPIFFYQLHNNEKNINEFNIFINNLKEENFYVFILVLGKILFDELYKDINIYSEESILQDAILLVEYVLHFLGIRSKFNEYISCPTCSRTTFNVQKVTEEIKEATKNFKNLKIAIMGCIINGPGEMKDADYGYVGISTNKVALYKKGKQIMFNVDEKDAISILVNIINKDLSESK